LTGVLERARELAARCDTLIVEGAGGLLSPLGEGFDTRDLIRRLRASPIVVASNRLGAVNQVRLVLAALPAAVVRRTQVVLVNPPKPDHASTTNTGLLAEFFPKERLHELPWLPRPDALAAALNRPVIARAIQAIATGCGLG
jgi:dethiobiotin synthetase